MERKVVTYSDRVTPVELGDHVLTRIWFWKHKGRVVYVPGLSPPNPAMEYGGLSWVGIRLDEGGFVSTVVDPKGFHLRRKELLLKRDPQGFVPLRPDDDPHATGEGTSP